MTSDVAPCGCKARYVWTGTAQKAGRSYTEIDSDGCRVAELEAALERLYESNWYPFTDYLAAKEAAGAVLRKNSSGDSGEPQAASGSPDQMNPKSNRPVSVVPSKPRSSLRPTNGSSAP